MQTNKTRLWEGKLASLASAGGAGNTATLPGSGGDSATVTLLSGNFGEWTVLSGLSESLVNMNYEPSFKTDLAAFPNRAITYIQAEFGISAAFAANSIVLGTLPVNSRPKANILQYNIVQNVELYLSVTTDGVVSLYTQTGENLPTTSGTPETEPFSLLLFYEPAIVGDEPTTYTSTRTQNFTRSNCGAGTTAGPSVAFSRNYTSTVSQAAADALAASDSTFATDGQANADENGTCLVVYTAVRTENFTKAGCGTGYAGSVVAYSQTYTSTISQADANNQAANDANFEAAGQANANANGTCLVQYEAGNGGQFANQTCPSGEAGVPTNYVKKYYSTISQADATAQAVADEANFAAESQADANINGACTIQYTATRSGTFTRDNCGDNMVGSQVEFNKTYYSIISQDDANTQAANDPDFEADGQAYANANATCSVPPNLTIINNLGASLSFINIAPDIYSQENIPAEDAIQTTIADGQNYTVYIKAGYNFNATVNGVNQEGIAATVCIFTGVSTPIYIDVETVFS